MRFIWHNRYTKHPRHDRASSNHQSPAQKNRQFMSSIHYAGAWTKGFSVNMPIQAWVEIMQIVCWSLLSIAHTNPQHTASTLSWRKVTCQYSEQKRFFSFYLSQLFDVTPSSQGLLSEQAISCEISFHCICLRDQRGLTSFNTIISKHVWQYLWVIL